MTAGGDSASSTQQPLGPKALQPEPGSFGTGAQEELILLFPCVFHKSPTGSRNGVNSRDVGGQPKAEHSCSLVGKQGQVSRGHRSNVLWRSGQGSLVHRELSVTDIQMLIRSKQHIASFICARKEKEMFCPCGSPGT